MDPFSTATAAITVIQVFVQAVGSLKKLRESVKGIQGEIDHLIAEVNAVLSLVASIQQIIERNAPSDSSLLKVNNLEKLFFDCERCLVVCKSIAIQVQNVVGEISGKGGSAVTSKRDAFTKEIRRRDKSGELQRLRDRLTVEKSNLQVLLIGMNIHHQDSSQETLTQISKEVRALDQTFKLKTTSLQNDLHNAATIESEKVDADSVALNGIHRLRESIQSVQKAIHIVSPNEFFDTPQPVRSFYTGRSHHLHELQNILLASITNHSRPTQLRFVIHGMGGSGKTQFCCKFAEINRENFWGVFYVDATSHDTIKQTYAKIGKMGNVEPNHVSAMHWLSNNEGRWLLIMDNADDRRIDLHQYFPRGDRGFIIITTRNPDHIQHGNVGPGFFEFQGMSDDEASALLLRAASLKEPWDNDSSLCAMKITKQLGSLALALVQAGAAIRCHLCRLKDYLGFYDRDWARIRHVRRGSISTSISRPEYDEYLSAHTTFEVSYRHIEAMGTEASRDAIQLLKMLSFFHPANIHFDVLKKAIENCEKESKEQVKANKEKEKLPLTWYQSARNLRLAIIMFINQDRSPSALPDLIKEGRASGFDNYRARRALRELHQMSLITYHESNDSYSIHPVIHKWARERPDMSASEQAVWAHAAALTISHSILLPPLGETEEDEIFRRDILPHVDHVMECQLAIDEQIQKRREKRFYGLFQWPSAGSSFCRDRALRYMKFSIVFAQNGRWKEAEALQLEVKRFADVVIGLDQSVTRRISLALSGTYWNQGRGDEAGDLQEVVLAACIKYLPAGHHETLLAMDTLGQTRWQQGRYTVAKELQTHVLDGLRKLRGSENHEDTLCAMGHLGRTLAKFYENLDEAKGLLEEAFVGMKKLFGPTHLKSLAVQEDLAMLAIQMNETLDSALESMKHILHCRKEKLGKEHPYALLAMVNISRVYIALGEYKEAESLIREGLSIADRNLGEGHIGTLMGRTVLGTILNHQSRFEEAESTLRGVIDKQRSLSTQTGDFHPDRIGAMIELAWCLRAQERLEESILICEDTIEALDAISQKEHPLETKMRAQRDEMLKILQNTK